MTPSTRRERKASRTRVRDLQPDARQLAANAKLDAAEAVAPVLGPYANGCTFTKLAKSYGVSNQEMYAWIEADVGRQMAFRKARDARALSMVDELHERTIALADGNPDDTHKVMARVKAIQWDASRTSRLFADKSVTETNTNVDITVHMEDAEVTSRLASLLGSLPGDVVDAEEVQQDQR